MKTKWVLSIFSVLIVVSVLFVCKGQLNSLISKIYVKSDIIEGKVEDLRTSTIPHDHSKCLVMIHAMNSWR